MSEFKFACPVCGQHITANTDAAGTRIECPTCFQKIVVPQGPASGDSKLILSATKVSAGRPMRKVEGGLGTHVFKPKYIPVFLPLVLLIALGALAYVYRDKLFRPKPNAPPTQITVRTSPPAAPPPIVFHPVPTNIHWTLDLADAVIPESTAAGSLRGTGFLTERAVLTGGTLVLRQAVGSQAELGVRIQLFAKTGEELAGKTIEITPERQPPQPKVVLLWKEEVGKGKTKAFENGYAIRLIFGQPSGGKMPGKVYLAMPDKDGSVVAGTFLADIKKPPPPKPKAPGIKPPAKTAPPPPTTPPPPNAPPASATPT